MPISLRELIEASSRARHVEVASTLTEARNLGLRTAFLSHSHDDAVYVRGLITRLREEGFAIYVDWLDTSMPSKPNRVTARKIKERIKQTNLFLFLATPNSMASRWCPWEIGYADGAKPIESIIVIPTTGFDGNYYGSEYLDLYRRLDISTDRDLAVWQPGRTDDGVIVRNL